MSLRTKRWFGMAWTMIYFVVAALGISWLLYEHKPFSWKSLDYLLMLVSLVYATGALFAFKEILRGPTLSSFSGPQFSPSTQKIIRISGLLIPLPVIAYAIFFSTTVHQFSANSSEWERTHALLVCEEPLFGHHRAQKLLMYFGARSRRAGNNELAHCYVWVAVKNTERNHPAEKHRLAQRQRCLSRICASLNNYKERDYWLSRAIENEGSGCKISK